MSSSRATRRVLIAFIASTVHKQSIPSQKLSSSASFDSPSGFREDGPFASLKHLVRFDTKHLVRFDTKERMNNYIHVYSSLLYIYLLFILPRLPTVCENG